MLIYLLAFFVWGMVYWILIGTFHRKIMIILEKILMKFMPEMGSVIVAWLLAVCLYGVIFVSPRWFFKVFFSDQDWRELAQINIFGIIFASCVYQFRKYLLERKRN
ncbi:MAG: hypothetical protein ACHP65_08930 [Legionellales bacterium]